MSLLREEREVAQRLNGLSVTKSAQSLLHVTGVSLVRPLDEVEDRVFVNRVGIVRPARIDYVPDSLAVEQRAVTSLELLAFA